MQSHRSHHRSTAHTAAAIAIQSDRSQPDGNGGQWKRAPANDGAAAAAVHADGGGGGRAERSGPAPVRSERTAGRTANTTTCNHSRVSTFASVQTSDRAATPGAARRCFIRLRFASPLSRSALPLLAHVPGLAAGASVFFAMVDVWWNRFRIPVAVLLREANKRRLREKKSPAVPVQTSTRTADVSTHV